MKIILGMLLGGLYLFDVLTPSPSPIVVIGFGFIVGYISADLVLEGLRKK